MMAEESSISKERMTEVTTLQLDLHTRDPKSLNNHAEVSATRTLSFSGQ